MTAFNSGRRDALVCGGAAILLASTGRAPRAADAAGRPPADDDAYAPWRVWDDPSIAGTPLALVAAGVLAANPHDTQPWLFAVGADAIEIFADRTRNLGAMDAYRREMHLGLGCAIENMALAAGPNGFVAEATASPGSLSALDEGEAPVHAATLRLTRREPTAPDPLYRAIPLRHTNRYATIPRKSRLPRGATSRARSAQTARSRCFCSKRARHSDAPSTPPSSRRRRRSSLTSR